MNTGLKIGLYVVLVIGTCVFGLLAYSNYNRLMENSPAPIEAAELEELPGEAEVEEEAAEEGEARYSSLLLYAGIFMLFLICLGLLFGHDFASFMGNRTLKMLYNDEGAGQVSAQYDEAEQEWANGRYLDAIRLMREYLNKYPREQHVALRIAEIYEKDLNNPLAAALEYEEVLKHKLPAERWGWAAIHLCNLYLRLNQEQKAVDLLRRIDAEYGETAAAEKARKRLAQIDPGQPESQEPESEPEPPPPDPPSHLPPGFSPRKR